MEIFWSSGVLRFVKPPTPFLSEIIVQRRRKAFKFLIALGLEKDDYKSELLIERWNNFNRPRLL